MKQATLREPVRFEGIGLHTGADAAVEVRPAAAETGISFLVGATRIPAEVQYVVDTSRATVLGRDGVTVSTTEHLLSALFAMGVSNAEIVVEGPEIPARDGSAAEFASGIATCGLRVQEAPRRIFEIDAPTFVRSRDRVIAALPAPAFRVRFVADFAAPIGTQYFDGEIDAQSYRADVAAARTFAYLHEIESLWAKGLGRGGSLENALVFTPEGPMQPLRWPDEAVRHKVLDLIGDLSLLGMWPKFEIVAIKSGHELHASLLRALRCPADVTSRVAS